MNCHVVQLVTQRAAGALLKQKFGSRPCLFMYMCPGTER